MDNNPFKAAVHDGVQTYYGTADDRVRMVPSFDRAQCEAALQLPQLQKTVAMAVVRRLRYLDNVKTYRITAPDCNDSEVTLRVDHNVLTHGVANSINAFSYAAGARLKAADNDPVQAIIRVFGAQAIAYLLGIGGADISTNNEGEREYWTKSVLDAHAGEWLSYAEMGISIMAAVVASVSFDDVELEEVE